MQPDDSERSLRSRVSQTLRGMILSGELRPGQRLLQQQLSKRFGVSQSVMRESLLEAQFTGLVDSVNGIGASVAAIDLPQLLRAYEVREMLEGLAARLCCAQASATHIGELTDLALQVHALGLAALDEQRAKLDRRFHERIIEISGNNVLQRLSGGYHIVRLVVLKSIPHDQILADHLGIVGAIKANDPDQAERVARQHVVSAREMVRQQVESSGFDFGQDALAGRPANPR
ncbi:MAG: GntR family transcriptional regulator [Tepidisphaeraceae bacterium]